MKITVLGNGPVKRKQVTSAIETIIDRQCEPQEVTLYAGTLDPDVAPDAMRFATDWALDQGVHVEIVSTDGDCAYHADVVLVAWDDAQVDAIEEWVKATHGKVMDLTTPDLAEISLEGEPDEAQQPSDEKVIKGVKNEDPVVDALVAAGRQAQEDGELIELGRAAKVFLDYIARAK